MEIRTVEYNSVEYVEMVELRNTVLLEPIGFPYLEEDFEQDEESIFCGMFDQGEIIGCCVLSPLDEEDHVRLRQMAIVDQRQHQGLGSKIIAFAEGVAKEHDFKEIHLIAQCRAEGFYKNNGYQAYGEVFMDAGVEHIMMKKSI